MILIIGGAYQGKLTFAKDAFGLEDSDVYTCDGPELDFSRRCVRSLETFTLECAKADVDAVARLREHRQQWQDTIFICRDISCGVVPLDSTMRKWRNLNGQVCSYLAGEAQRVSRIFCGLEDRLK